MTATYRSISIRRYTSEYVSLRPIQSYYVQSSPASSMRYATPLSFREPPVMLDQPIRSAGEQ